MSEELKSCPFCGSTNSLKVFGANTDDTLVLSSYVSCEGCHSEGPIKKTIPAAITAWNTRAGEKTIAWAMIVVALIVSAAALTIYGHSNAVWTCFVIGFLLFNIWGGAA